MLGVCSETPVKRLRSQKRTTEMKRIATFDDVQLRNAKAAGIIAIQSCIHLCCYEAIVLHIMVLCVKVEVARQQEEDSLPAPPVDREESVRYYSRQNILHILLSKIK